MQTNLLPTGLKELQAERSREKGEGMGVGHTRKETHFLIIKYEQTLCLAITGNFLFNPKTNFLVNKRSIL